MNLRDGTIFSFDCKLKSPFHTTQREYRNLLKCAPFIAGTTFRGAVLKALIELNCKKNDLNQLKRLNDPHEVRKLHSQCSEDCIVKPFFDLEKINAIFSCGLFEGKPKYDLFTRIALTKDSQTAAEGMIVNTECISSGVDFRFSISLFDDALDVVDGLKDAIDLASQNGIGRFKSIGFGRFDIENIREENVEDLIWHNAETFEFDNPKVEIKLQTPFVFNNSKEAFNTKNLGNVFTTVFTERYNDMCVDRLRASPSISSTEMRLIPEFLNRYSYEIGKKESRLSAGIESQFWLEFDDVTEDIKNQLAVGSAFGIGLWCNCGFGKFFVETA